MIKDEEFNKLIEFAELDGTEWGEMILAIDALWGRRDYIDEKTKKALEKEITEQWKWAKENLTIVESVETITRPVRTLEQL